MRIFFIILIIRALFVFSTPAAADDLVISLPDGPVRGTTYTTENNKTYYGFQGIPFATPPVGNLRFEAPQPPQPWSEIWDATKDSKICYSAFIGTQDNSVSEDCLYINVYTPSLKPAEKLPVLVWIYGGKFITGASSKTAFGPDYLIEEDVVFVSFNYRTGVFGFLSTGDLAIVGNAGLKDQTLAIKWAHDNVAYFGGDPEKITIFGESAGGASTGLQLVSKTGTGLYRAAIVQSGSAVTNWTIDINPRKYAEMLTSALGGDIYLNDTNKIKLFLQEKTPEEIMNVMNSMLEKDDQQQPWPVVEVEHADAFLSESPCELLTSGRFNQVPIIIGICANEALTFLQGKEAVEAMALRFDTNPDILISNNLRSNESDREVVINTMKNLYLQEGETFSSNLVAMSSIYSDGMFVKGILKHAELASKFVRVYLYQFAYAGTTMNPYYIDGAEKAGHGTDLLYLFKTYYHDITDQADKTIRSKMVRLWTNFAKYLNPTPETSEQTDVVWTPMNASSLQYLNINSTLAVQSPLRGSTYEGWNYIYETYGKKPFITF